MATRSSSRGSRTSSVSPRATRSSVRAGAISRSPASPRTWGLVGVQQEAAFASTRVIVVVEELVDEAVIRSDPNRTLIPGMIVDAVVVEPWGAHPSYAQGYYDRDNDFYVAWEGISRGPGRLEGYLEEYVRGVADRAAYMAKQPSLVARLKAQERYSSGVNYGF